MLSEQAKRREKEFFNPLQKSLVLPTKLASPRSFTLRRAFLTSSFTFLEIMLVVVIIALLAAISIPNLLKTIIKANETAAKAVLQTIATAQISYHNEHSTFGTLKDLVDNSYIKEELAGDGTLEKHGYVFFVYNSSKNDFCVSASPVTPDKTGELAFCITDSATLRYKDCPSLPCSITTVSECSALSKVP